VTRGSDKEPAEDTDLLMTLPSKGMGSLPMGRDASRCVSKTQQANLQLFMVVCAMTFDKSILQLEAKTSIPKHSEI
jgi:hypothetical protein